MDVPSSNAQHHAVQCGTLSLFLSSLFEFFGLGSIAFPGAA